ncbi:MAG: hypothetical protein KC560_21075 [Myxococcales bacterium]|nr:hypothetical protein [Myxococcales bacterium]
MAAARTLALVLLSLALLGGSGPCGGAAFQILEPRDGALTRADVVDVRVRVPGDVATSELRFALDGVPVAPSGLARTGDVVTGQLTGALGGPRTLVVALAPDPGAPSLAAHFEGLALHDPDHCEVLNDAECLYPFPSSRFLRFDPTSPTDWRVDLPAEAMPDLVVGDIFGFTTGARAPLDPTPYLRNDGFSPMVQILVHFPAGFDPAASGAAVLDPATRTFDLGSLAPGHPTVIVDAETGERIAHFVENDDRGTPGRTATILRPATSLLPGRRYLVGVRHAVDASGQPIEAEPVFAALRDGRPTQIPAVEARRAQIQNVLHRLEDHGVDPDELVLAFDFVTQSDEGLTGEMLAMRDAAIAWADAQPPSAIVTQATPFDLTPPAQCAPGVPWRAVLGRILVPNFLTTDPSAPVPPPADPVGARNTVGVLAHDAAGNVLQTGAYEARFGMSIPCDAILTGPVRPLVFGHGLFGDGPSDASSLVFDLAPYVADLQQRGLVSPGRRFDIAAAGTHWSGLSSLDIAPIPSGIDFSNLSPSDLAALIAFSRSFIGQIFVDFDRFEALPDRLRQGQTATIVLARLLENGALNAHPAFQAPAGGTVPAGQGLLAAGEVNYLGASLGGIMGLMFTSLYPDIERSIVDVPGANFSLLLQRAKPFKAFQTVLEVIEPDPMRQLAGLGLLHELWVKGESAGYLHHLSGKTLPRFPGSGPKNVLMSVAKYDQQVTPLGAQIAAATIGLENLAGSDASGLPLVPDRVGGPALSGHVLYDTGAYALGTPTEVFVPPVVNRPAPVDDNRCDPHGTRFTIPASLEQVLAFLEPNGRIENFCNGACDAAEPLELPGGLAAPCDPLAP